MRTLIELTISEALIDPSALEHTYRTSRFLHLIFQLAMIPASGRWVLDVVFFGKNTTLMLGNFP
jgi:hypothetical protein